MSTINILELAKSYLNTSNVGKLAGQLNEEPSAVQHGLNAILPSVLGAVMQKASTTRGAGEVLEVVRGYEENNLLSNLPDILSNGDKFQQILAAGKKLLPVFFEGTLPGLSAKISEDTGLKQSSSNSLIGIVAPLILSIIGSDVKSSGYGLSGLTSHLMGQKNAVLAALPAGFSSLLNFKDLGDFKGSEETHVKHEYEEKKKSSWPIWLIVILAILGLLWILKTCKKDETVVVNGTGAALDSATVAVSDLVDSTAGKIKDGLEVLGSFFKRKLPNGVELNIPEFGIENKLVTFIEDKDKLVDKTTWFNFDRITFETGSNKLSAESLEQTKNIAEILKAFPAASLKIGGYTDNTGTAAINKKLSQERADAVKAAIVSEGVATERLDAEGYGPEHPVASNDTEEGRAQNRRIAVRVTKK
ncbi:flagellar motor protein MotB [Dyadobacter luteus]|uniref:Flagellar motor protein MotB n=1 Tax=Dyadobacter luteus TaxID=2259619 RepID=A0A3D8YF52_9BACT|nr:OmpA family protein [Dyadobacter luteus]REA61647.1 flagellar motor protein MotB [Dyadobacter luteus]